MVRPQTTSVIFDMDGVLLESESLWRQAEQEVSDELGLGFTAADFEATTGVRIRDVTQLWYATRPWEGPSPEDVARSVTDRVVDLVADRPALPGVHRALGLVADRGLRLALCSSSDTRLIDAVVANLGLEGVFEVVHSAERDEFGKPHPMPYLHTAERLGVRPAECVAVEDSVNGAISARAALMGVIAVPPAAQRGSGRLGFADLTLDSLTQLDQVVLDAVVEGRRVPTISRPRFHLAVPVDDLAAARWFYGEVLGCPEGRSDQTWVDFDLYGHQVVAHLTQGGDDRPPANSVDGHEVPSRHFGVLLHPPAWRDLVRRLERAGSAVPWIIEPTTRFAGKPGEQHTGFVLDPAGNALEFKAFLDDDQVFAR